MVAIFPALLAPGCLNSHVSIPIYSTFHLPSSSSDHHSNRQYTLHQFMSISSTLVTLSLGSRSSDLRAQECFPSHLDEAFLCKGASHLMSARCLRGNCLDHATRANSDTSRSIRFERRLCRLKPLIRDDAAYVDNRYQVNAFTIAKSCLKCQRAFIYDGRHQRSCN
jgi:hypothetical protein